MPDTSRPFLKLIRILAEITVRTRMKMQRESDLLAGEALVAQFSELLPVRSFSSFGVGIGLTWFIESFDTNSEELQLPEDSSTLPLVPRHPAKRTITLFGLHGWRELSPRFDCIVCCLEQAWSSATGKNDLKTLSITDWFLIDTSTWKSGPCNV